MFQFPCSSFHSTECATNNGYNEKLLHFGKCWRKFGVLALYNTRNLSTHIYHTGFSEISWLNVVTIRRTIAMSSLIIVIVWHCINKLKLIWLSLSMSHSLCGITPFANLIPVDICADGEEGCFFDMIAEELWMKNYDFYCCYHTNSDIWSIVLDIRNECYELTSKSLHTFGNILIAYSIKVWWTHWSWKIDPRK